MPKAPPRKSPKPKRPKRKSRNTRPDLLGLIAVAIFLLIIGYLYWRHTRDAPPRIIIEAVPVSYANTLTSGPATTPGPLFAPPPSAIW